MKTKSKVDSKYKKTKWGRIESQISDVTTKFLIYHGSLPSEIVDQILTLVLSEDGLNISTKRLEKFVRYCVESFIYTDDAEKYFERFKKLSIQLKMRLAVHTKLPELFITTNERRKSYLELLNTIKSDEVGWSSNMRMEKLHYELLSTNVENVEKCDDFIHVLCINETSDSKMDCAIKDDSDGSNPEKTEDENTQIAAGDSNGLSAFIMDRLGCDLMAHYLKNNRTMQAQSLAHILE